MWMVSSKESLKLKQSQEKISFSNGGPYLWWKREQISCVI